MVKNRNSIKQEGNNNIAIQNSEITFVNLSVRDHVKILAQQNQYEGIIHMLEDIKDEFGKIHPFYPNYKYKITKFADSVLVEHIPRSNEIAKSLPLKFQGKFNISGANMKGFSTLKDLLYDAYLKRESIEIEMKSLQAIIGEHEVDTPMINDFISAGKWYIAPTEVPKTYKVKYFKRKGDMQSVIFEYLEVSMTEDNDEYIVIDNRWQRNAKIYFGIKIYNKVGLKTKINIKINKEFIHNIEANLLYLNFVYQTRQVEKEAQFVLKDLENNTNYFVFNSKNFGEIVNKIDNLTYKIKTLERLIELENKLKVEFAFDGLSEMDIENIARLEAIYSETKTFSQKLRCSTLSDIKAGDLKNITKNGQYERMEFVEGNGAIVLLGVEIPYKSRRRSFASFKIDKYEQLCNKLDLLDDSDKTSLTLIPKGEYILYQEIYE